jgi:hypothetical protein
MFYSVLVETNDTQAPANFQSLVLSLGITAFPVKIGLFPAFMEFSVQ